MDALIAHCEDLADFLDALADETGRADVRNREQALRSQLESIADAEAGDDL